MGYLLEARAQDPAFVPRIIFDLGFYFTIPLIAISIIFGIVIDTFAQLRAEKEDKQRDMISNCFICSLPRDLFDRHAKGFEHHIHHDHNLWAYLYFMTYLRYKPKEDYTGIESYVASCIARNSTEFFPTAKALALKRHQDEEKRSSGRVETQVEQLREEMARLTEMMKAMVQAGAGQRAGHDTATANAGEAASEEQQQQQRDKTTPKLPKRLF
jgi:hypothetical protein